MPVLPEDIHLVVVDVHEVAEGYRASKLISKTVVNDQNEKIGTIEDIIIGKAKVPLSSTAGRRISPHRRAYSSGPLSEPRSRRKRRQINLPGATQEALKSCRSSKT